MEMNTDNGIYDKFGLIERCICELDMLEVRGVQNMSIIFGVISKLTALKKGLREEEQQHEQTSDESKGI